jgi:glutamate N-acetyltransferase/amino-acid N-acetyltransferase
MPEPHALPRGFRAAGVQCGIRRSRPDLALLLADAPASAAAVFTSSLLHGAHVTVCRAHLAASGGRVRAVLVNSGNANCSTGAAGIADNRRVAAALAEVLGCPPAEVLFLSTGVIGARLPVERVLAGLPELVGALAGDGLDDFARAIMTTDTRPKVHGSHVGDARVTGVAKGSGMIHPDFATMFGFLLTDASPSEPAALLRRVCRRSFERVSVDGDTSPNDTVVLLASEAHGALPGLEAALGETAVALAREIAADGEGATRLITVRVLGAPDEAAAARVGRTIATSPLTKTAVAGRDPNWGRILAAAARAGVPFDPERARVRIGPGEVYALGTPHPEAEPAAHRHMLEEREVLIEVDLAAGTASADIWTCDFTADYVRINADYRS